MTPKVRIQWTDYADTGLAPLSYASREAAGADIRANFPEAERYCGRTIPVRGVMAIPAGVHLEIPRGFEAQVRPRSGLAKTFGVTVLNSPGTIDSDYRGEVFVLLINLGSAAFTVKHGARIAQLVIAPVSSAEFEIADGLDSTDRGSGGFGSTGID